MSAGVFCTSPKEHRPQWRVLQRNCNHSTFNGRRRTWSAYSEVRCLACWGVWRTKAKYVETVPDAVGTEGYNR